MPGVSDRNSIPLLDCEFPRAGPEYKVGHACPFLFFPFVLFIPSNLTIMSYFYGNLNDEINLGDGWDWMQDMHTEEDGMVAFLGVVSRLVDGADLRLRPTQLILSTFTIITSI